MQKHLCLFLYVFMAMLVAGGCSFLRLEKELKELEQVRVLSGQISNRANQETSLIVLLFAINEQGLMLARSIIIGPGLDRFAMETNTGKYYVAAFEDINSNLAYDENEPAGFYGKPDQVAVTASTPTTITGLDIVLTKENEKFSRFTGFIALSPENLAQSFVTVGRVIDFKDPRLGGDYGRKGYWAPLFFIREIGFCLYFLEPYDPKKIPVLFIHGALGSPLGWKKTIDYLDRSRFQPWFYYYPSGLPIENISTALNKMVLALQRQHAFKEMYVVAQSMGGLVGRSFILKNIYASQQHFIKKFISVSTPWNGHKMTAQGVKNAPTAVPSWHDMIPESAFIQSLYQQKLPSWLQYYLIFSYRGDCSMFLANNDGTVELSSQLDWRAQKDAETIFGYDEDHGSILESEMVLRQIGLLLGAKSIDKE